MTSTTDPQGKSTREIERELEEERERVRRTSRELQDRMTFGSLVDEVMRRGGGDFTHRLAQTIRDNPIPVTVIAVCLAWIMAGGQRASLRHSRSGDRRVMGYEEDDLLPARRTDLQTPGGPSVGMPPPVAAGPTAGSAVAAGGPLGEPHDREDEGDDELALGAPVTRPPLAGTPESANLATPPGGVEPTRSAPPPPASAPGGAFRPGPVNPSDDEGERP